MNIRTIVREAWLSTSSSLGRNLLTGSGVLLASAAFVATTGLSSTLSAQVSSTFDAQRATEVLVTQAASPDADAICRSQPQDRVKTLAGVLHAGPYAYWAPQRISRPDVGSSTTVPVAGLSEDTYAALQVSTDTGRRLDPGYFRRGDSVAVVSRNVARALALTSGTQVIRLFGRDFTVVGTYDAVARRPEIADAVLVPAAALFDSGTPVGPPDQLKCQYLASTVPGAASELALNIALVLKPNNPNSLTVVAPPDPTQLRRSLERPVRNLAFALSAVVLLIGGLTIGTSTSSSLIHRRNELGLRKALGARTSTVLLQLLLESSIVGGIAAVTGVLIGAYVVVAVGIANDWSPVLDLPLASAACLAGAAVGAVGGLLPAARAAMVSPSVSLRR